MTDHGLWWFMVLCLVIGIVNGQFLDHYRAEERTGLYGRPNYRSRYRSYRSGDYDTRYDSNEEYNSRVDLYDKAEDADSYTERGDDIIGEGPSSPYEEENDSKDVLNGSGSNFDSSSRTPEDSSSGPSGGNYDTSIGDSQTIDMGSDSGRDSYVSANGGAPGSYSGDGLVPFCNTVASGENVESGTDISGGHSSSSSRENQNKNDEAMDQATEEIEPEHTENSSNQTSSSSTSSTNKTMQTEQHTEEKYAPLPLEDLEKMYHLYSDIKDVDDLLFVRYIAHELRKITRPIKRLQVRTEILRLILSYAEADSE